MSESLSALLSKMYMQNNETNIIIKYIKIINKKIIEFKCH